MIAAAVIVLASCTAMPRSRRRMPGAGQEPADLMVTEYTRTSQSRYRP
jgi:hypothetical protein